VISAADRQLSLTGVLESQPLKRFRSIELFTGAGGLALGSHLAGFDHEALIEWNQPACETLAANAERDSVPGIKHWHVIRGDAREVQFADFGSVDLIAGGPPCQPFSIGGKARGMDDSRDMIPQFVRAVRELQPSAFILENVRGLIRPMFRTYFSYVVLQLTHPDAVRRQDETWEEHLRRLEDLHTAGKDPDLRYNVVFRLLNAADYGVPQTRERVFIVEPWRTVRDAIHDLPEPFESQDNLGAVTNHLFRPGARAYAGHTGSLLDWPAKTLKAGDHGVPGGENMIAFADGRVRYFTVREAARLQTFPDAWQVQGVWSEAMRQLGNAVPVELAQIVAESVARSLREHRG
jgi:DNA (cytosine-5)-methyltransferase 1